jgi:penicillin-binding protein 1B
MRLRSAGPLWLNLFSCRKEGQVKKEKPSGISRFIFAIVAAGLIAAAIIGVLSVYYHRFSRMIDERLSGKSFRSESRVFTSPKRITIGEAVSLEQLESYLQAAGYSKSPDSRAAGRITISPSSIEIRPSANSYFGGKNALRIDFSRRRISQLRSLDSGDRLMSAEIEPELITDLFGAAREKRRPVRYSEFPPLLRNAILCAEDKRFFEHPGFDPLRVLAAAWTDLRRGEKAQGASTITMQVARSFFFSTRREWRRKLEETYMALILEHRFYKEQIFELYANEVYLGNRGSFAIHGFGEASQAYFGKDVRDLNLAEACFLAGIIRAPNRYSSAERRPERAAEARDRTLRLMLENGLISPEQEQQAMKAPLRLVSGTFGASLAGHFIDMMKDDLLDKFSETELDSQSYRIYTTLDSDLQRAAMSAADWGLKNIDLQLAKTYESWRRKGEEVPLPQVALIALNPHSGEIKALLGGRDYAKSQLNHALVKRQPGSVFKPFVYAAAFENALNGTEPVLLPTSTVVDEPTTFIFDGREYTPDNYGKEFYGTVTLRDALVHSLNVATVKVAQEVGYGRVVEMAKRLGLESDIKPTPAVALGAYEMTPLEIAAGYTAFANYGTKCEITSLQKVVSRTGDLLEKNAPKRAEVLDPRVTYLVTNILEDVINRGTGAGVRARGFRAPAAGKTGTSHDGWFAGYTTNLLCVVWVGFDDNRELGLSGANSAGPIWAEFMKRAVMLPGFVDAQEFERPEGVVSVTIDPESQQLATPACPVTRQEVFISGTEPTEACTLHKESTIDGIPGISWLRRIFKRSLSQFNQSGSAASPFGRR